MGLSILVRCRHDDLKEMLDSNKDSLKLEAMKRIVAVSCCMPCCAVPCHAVPATLCHTAPSFPR